MFCHKCGTKLPDEAKFCHKCGAKTPVGDADKEAAVPSYSVQKPEEHIFPEQPPWDDVVMDEQKNEPVSVARDSVDFKEFINTHVRKTTKYQSAEELLNSKVSQKYLWICFGIPAILVLFVFIKEPALEIILGGIGCLLILAYPIALLIDTVLSLRVNRGEYKTSESIDTNDLMQFLSENLSYLAPYFHKWGYIRLTGVGLSPGAMITAAAVAEVQNALQGTRIGTEFGRRKGCFVEIHIGPDHQNLESGQMVYFFSTAIKSLWPAKYVCKVKSVPILQAAMDYYLNVSHGQEASIQTEASNLSEPVQPQSQVLTDVSKKKKSKKLLIVPAVIAVFVVILLAVKSGDSDRGGGYETQQNTTGVSLSETYRNQEEGIYFKYPGAWVPVSEEEFIRRYGGVEGEEYPIVFLANEEEDIPEENSYIAIGRLDATQEMIDHLFIDDEAFAATFDDDVTIETTSITKIDGINARKIVYHEGNGTSFQSYFYVVGSKLYRIDFNYFGESAGNKQRFFDAIIGSYEITSNGNEEEAEQLQEEIFGFETDYKEAYSDKIRKLSAEDDTLQFALISLTGNDVPELVADCPGYYVSVFAWVDEGIVTLMDQWPYGAMGNMGYEYLPGRNVIRNYNMDYAGAVTYESYLMVDANYEVVSIFDEELSIRYIRDTNANGMIDEEDEYSDEPVYYCNETEITEEEYASWQIAGDYQQIAGDIPADTMIELLQELEG